MMGQVYGTLGDDCYFSREKKRFYVKVAALPQLHEVIEEWRDDFTPRVKPLIGNDLDSAFK